MVRQAHHDNYAHDDTDNFIPRLSSDEVHFTIKIYNILIREVATLVNQYQKTKNNNYQFSIVN